MALTTAQGSAAYLNRAFNAANATVTAFSATVADLTAGEIAAANKFDVPTLTDAALAKQVLTNMGLLPTTNTSIAALEPALADYFATTGKGNRGFVVLQLARILADKTADATYGTAATAWNTTVAASIVDSTIQNVSLTTAKDALVGGQGDDTFTGGLSTLSANDTLGATDTINGGAGNDTLKLTLEKLFSGFTTGGLTSVEKVELTNNGASAFDYDATGSVGVNTYTINAAKAPITLSDVQSGVTTYNVNGLGADGLTTFAFASVLDSNAAERAGTADTVALNVNGVGYSSSYPMTTDIDYIETVNLGVTGANYVSLSGSANIKTLNVTGAGTVNITAVPTTLTKFDASAATGAVTANLTGTTAQLTKIAMGSGSDTLTLATEDFSGTATISGGAGTNALTMTNTTASKVAEYTMSGFQTLTIGASDQAMTFSGANTTDLTAIKIGSTTSEATTFVNMGSGALSFTGTGVTKEIADISSDHTGATTLTLTAVKTTATDTPLADYSFPESTGALTINVGGAIGTTNATVITSPKVTSLALTTTSKLTTAGAELTSFSSQLSVPKATTFTVNSGGTLGTNAAITAAIATSATITNGSNSGAIAINAAKLTDLTVTTGATLDFSSATADAAVSPSLAYVEKLNVTNTSGTTTFGALAKLQTATISGTGVTTNTAVTDSIFSSGALGQSSNTYDMAVTATGFKGGYTSGALNTGAGYDIAFTGTGLTGAVTLGAIGSSNVDDITVNVAGAGGAVSVGAMTAAGDITFNAAGAGATTVSTFTGDKVSVDLSGTGSSSSGTLTVTAATSATITGSSLVANTISVTGADTNTATTGALTVYAKGGILADTLTITGASTQTSVTVTGDMGASLSGTSDTVTIKTVGNIDISGLKNYETSLLQGYRDTSPSTSSANTIVGGAGADVIVGSKGQDTLTGNGGADSFRFNDGDSLVSAPDTIVDFSAADEIWYDGATVTMATSGTGTVSGVTATINSYGVAVLSGTTPATLTDAANAVNAAVGENTGYLALFTFGGSTYAYIDATGSSTPTQSVGADLVIKLTGVALPSAANVDSVSTTGISGFVRT